MTMEIQKKKWKIQIKKVEEKDKKLDFLEKKLTELEVKIATFENIEKTVTEQVTKFIENSHAVTHQTMSNHLIKTSQVMVKEITETVVATLMKRQEDFEAKNLAMFDSFDEHLTKISHFMKPKPIEANSRQNEQMSSPIKLVKFPCEVCRKEFETERAMRNHNRRDHEPIT